MWFLGYAKVAVGGKGKLFCPFGRYEPPEENVWRETEVMMVARFVFCNF